MLHCAAPAQPSRPGRSRIFIEFATSKRKRIVRFSGEFSAHRPSGTLDMRKREALIFRADNPRHRGAVWKDAFLLVSRGRVGSELNVLVTERVRAVLACLTIASFFAGAVGLISWRVCGG